MESEIIGGVLGCQLLVFFFYRTCQVNVPHLNGDFTGGSGFHRFFSLYSNDQNPLKKFFCNFK